MRSAVPRDRRVASRQRLLAACLGLLFGTSLFASTEAHAHASPQVRAVVFGDDRLGRVLVSNRGLLFGGVAGSGWRLMCNEALGVTTSELPELVSLPDGGMLAATSRGLKASHDGGCSWQSVEPFATIAVLSLARHPELPGHLYATACGKGASGLYASDDSGAHWKRLLAAGDGDCLRSIRVAPNHSEHLYVRKLALERMRFAYTLWSSSDSGESWISHPVTLNADETDFVLLGVSPSRPNLLIAKAEAANPGAVAERLLVSRDGGQSFESEWSARSINAAEWSADGASLWIASDEGLFRSLDEGHTFERQGPAELVSCLKQTEQGLLLCGHYRGDAVGMVGVGTTSDAGQTTATWMLMTDVTEPVACEDDAPTVSTCAPYWADWKREVLDGAEPSAAGSPTTISALPQAGAGAGANVSPAASAGCSVATSSRSGPLSTCLLLMGAAALRACKRRRPSGAC